LKDNALKGDLHKWLKALFRDPVVKTLTENSHMTKIQLETFLIDVLAEKISGKPIMYEGKARLRLIKSGVSRGAFNRSLAQARRNIIRSIYTIILLGYLGVFDTPSLDPYLEIANKVNSYTEAYRESWKDGGISSEHLRVLRMLQQEIEKGLQQLSKESALSERA
jgi:hypothetical protein